MTKKPKKFNDGQLDQPTRRTLWGKLLQLPATLLSGLTALSEVGERGWRGLAKRTSGVSEVTGRAEGWLGKTFNWLAWPFRLPIRMLAGFVDKASKLPIGRTVVPLMGMLFYPFTALAGFLAAFYATRRRELIWWGIPLVVIGIVTAGLMYGYSIGNRNALPRRYREAFEKAVSNQEFQQAELYRQKLMQLGQPFEQSSLRSAEKLFEEGQIDAAFATVEEIAPLNSPGITAGHFWMAKHLLGTRLPSNMDDQTALESAKKHLAHLQTLKAGEFPEVVILEALVALREENIPLALETLKRAHQKSVAATAMRMELLLALGDERGLRDESAVFLSVVNATPRFTEIASPEFFPVWSIAEKLAGSHLGLGTVLSAWYRRFPEDGQALGQLAEWRMGDLNSVGVGTPKSEAARLVSMMDEVSRMIGMEQRDLFSNRMNLIQTESATIPVFAAVLDGLARIESPASQVLEFFGTEAAMAEDYDAAKNLLSQATIADSKNYVAWNNLAYVIWKQNPAASGEALVAVERSLALKLDNVDARETRGRILLELEQWQRAIDDLEFALIAQPENMAIHQGLAEAYDQLGNRRMGDVHRRQLTPR